MSRAGAKEEAATVLAPLRGEQICLSVSTASTLFIVPTSIAGRWIRVKPDGGSIDMQFGSSACTLTYGKTSTVGGSGTITVSSNTGAHIEDGQAEDFICPKITNDYTHFAIIATAATKVYIQPT